MALTVDDLYRHELLLRTEAERKRKEGVDCAVSTATEVQAYGKRLRHEADSLDLVADLLVGCQGNWAAVAPLLRAGHVALRGEFERRKAAKGEAAA